MMKLIIAVAASLLPSFALTQPVPSARIALGD